jgi:glycosyltransferase involved in cell wall biosynthesis
VAEPANAITVIVPVLDDRDGMRELLEALADQSRLPDECVVVDGGSLDGTAELLAGWSAPFPLRIITRPGRNIAAARNTAIEASTSDWIACTDAGCHPAREWLAAVDAARPTTDFVAGVVTIEGRTPLERVLALTHYPASDELDSPPAWIRLSHRLFGRGYVQERSGGGNMAFSKALWRAVGGFPEEVYAGEDRALTTAALRAGFRITRSPDAVVAWHPPSTWLDNARMFYTYSRGDIRFPGRKRHAARLAAWLFGGRALAASWPVRGAAALGGAAYLALPFHRAQRGGLPLIEWWRIPLAVAVKDIAQIAGAARGLLDAAAGMPQPPPPRRPRRTGR